MERICIIGGCGAGKSTLARELGRKLNILVVHLDKLFWRDNWENVSSEDFKARLLKELEKDKWIMDGNYTATLNERFKYADTIIFLDLSTLTYLTSIVKRWFAYRGKTREDMGENCPERWDWEFFWYTATFNKKQRKQIYKKLETAQDKKIIIFKSRKMVKKFIKDI